MLPKSLRTLLVLVVASCAFIPSVRAQDEPEPPTPKKTVQRRGFPGGFGGLTPAEAKLAQEGLEKGKALEAVGKDSAALGAYKRVYKKYPRSPSAPEAYYRSGQIFLKRGKFPNAFEAIDVVVRAYPNYGKFNELISEEYKIAYDVLQGRVVKRIRFIPSFTNRERGIEFFERLVLNAPYSDYAPLALMNIADAHARLGNTDMAIDALDRLITNYPNSIVASDGYLRLAQIHQKLVDGPLYDQGSTQEAIDHYQDFLILFPTDPKVGDAEKGLAQMKEMLAQSRIKIADFYYFKRARYTAAKVFYNEAITTAPTSQAAQIARERIARVEADEAQAEARRVAEAERPPRRRFLGLLPAKTPPPAPGVVVPGQPAEAPKSPPAVQSDAKP